MISRGEETHELGSSSKGHCTNKNFIFTLQQQPALELEFGAQVTKSFFPLTQVPNISAFLTDQLNHMLASSRTLAFILSLLHAYTHIYEHTHTFTPTPTHIYTHPFTHKRPILLKILERRRCFSMFLILIFGTSSSSHHKVKKSYLSTRA